MEKLLNPKEIDRLFVPSILHDIQYLMENFGATRDEAILGLVKGGRIDRSIEVQDIIRILEVSDTTYYNFESMLMKKLKRMLTVARVHKD